MGGDCCYLGMKLRLEPPCFSCVLLTDFFHEGTFSATYSSLLVFLFTGDRCTIVLDVRGYFGLSNLRYSISALFEFTKVDVSWD